MERSAGSLKGQALAVEGGGYGEGVWVDFDDGVEGFLDFGNAREVCADEVDGSELIVCEAIHDIVYGKIEKVW